MRAVYRVFKQLYDKGYIYRDNYMVNWDPGSHSAISDLEVENREVEDTLYSIDYPVEGVRPGADRRHGAPGDDARRHRRGGQSRTTSATPTWSAQHCVLPLVGRRLPIIADEHVDPEFGTGALKITPGHDPNDFEIGRRHGLEEIGVIGPDGRMTEEAGERFAGLTAAEAQEAVVAALREEGLLRAEEPYVHSVPFSHRSGERIEPLISLQWFCRMDELAKPAIEAVERDEVRITPPQWKRVYLDWMREIRPWCISRQLWWGHRIPVWYCDACEETFVAEQAPGALRRLRRRAAPGGGRARHLVQLGALAVRDARLARRHAGAARLLPDQLPHHGARDPLPLGGADDHDRDRVRRRRPLPRRLRALGDPGPRRAADVEEPRHRDRPAGGDRRARRRRAALRPAGDVLDPGRALLRRQGPAGRATSPTSSGTQPADPAQRRRGRGRAAAGHDRGPLAPLAAGGDDRLGHGEAGGIRLRPRRPGGLRVLLVGALRLVPGDRQAAPLRRRGGGLGDAALGAGARAGAAAPADALRHRGDLVLPPARGRATSRSTRSPRPTSRCSTPRPRPRCGRGSS